MEAQSSIGDYTITQKIGEGSFGQIFEAVKEEVTYAIKTVFQLLLSKALTT
jgi:serine/threonine protein kinase